MCLRAARYGRSGRDPRRARRVPGWHRNNGPYKPRGEVGKEHWPETKFRLLDGTYEPQPVLRVEIPKASGGVRPLGVPKVLDRFIQQAVMQVLQGDWDGCELRVPARTLGPSGGRARAGAHPGGLRLRGRSRSRKVFRPGEPRHSDGAGGQARGQQTPAQAHPRLPDRGRTGRWAGSAQPPRERRRADRFRHCCRI